MNAEDIDLAVLKRKIEQIDALARELQESGAGIPVIEKNARSILSFTHILKFGIADAAELPEEERRDRQG